MEQLPTKTARFESVVKEIGAPEAVNLWTRPEDDPALMKAVKLDRVMTLRQTGAGGKRDYGLVGFVPGPKASFLIFPRSLKKYQGRRVVGIKYDLVKMSGPVGHVVKGKAVPSAPVRPKLRPNVRREIGKPTEPKDARVSGFRETRPRSSVFPTPAERKTRSKRFAVLIRFTATADVTVEVEAESRNKAGQKAAAMLRVPDFTGATVTRKILTTKPLE